MPKTKSSKTKALAMFLAVVFAFSPLSFGGTIEKNEIRADEPEIIFPDQNKITEIKAKPGESQFVWRKADNIEIDGAVVVKSGTMLVIEPGTKIKFKRNEGEIAPFIFVEKGAMIMAEGTESEKIIFTSDQDDSHFSIIFDGFNDGHSYSGFFRYAEISKAGGEYEIDQDTPPSQALFPFFAKKALAEEAIVDYRFPLRHLGGTLVMENCRMNGNQSADLYISDNQIDPSELNGVSLVGIINSNFENNDSGIALRDDHVCLFSEGVSQDDCENVLMIKNNYYGKTTGPYLIKNSYQYYLDHKDEFLLDDQFGGKIIGANTVFHGFRKKDLIADPVIVIPGIMGSEKGMIGNDLQLDPILHTYDNLLDSLQDNGYEKNINLFEFPYEWRNSNVQSAQELGEKIDQLRQELLVDRFDVVAHSMGGLVARQYIQSDQYQWGIDQLITLGTPHHGSPEAYLKWEAGEGFFRIDGLLAKHHFSVEALHSGYLSLFKYIQEKTPSVAELLPEYDYLEKDDEILSYPDNYPRNEFLENLNENNLGKLNSIRFTNIVGNLDIDNTISKIRITGETDGNKWEHGKPENFDDKNTDRGLIFGNGDETVPLSSARAENLISAENTLEINSNHNDLPTEAQCEILQKLSGQKTCIFTDHWDIPNILLFNLFSPVDVQIVAPDGKKIGKDFATGEPVNEIDGAYYSGFDTENEFVTIPNPQEGKYQILTEGTDGGGDYKIESVLVRKNEESLEGAEESSVVFEGQTEEGEMKEEAVEVKEGQVKEAEEEPQDQTPPQITITSPKNEKAYQNISQIDVGYEITDDVSLPENIQKKITLDGEEYDKDKIELWMFKAGEHEFAVEATDEAENVITETAKFNNLASYRNLAINTGKYHQAGLIKSRGNTRYLQLKFVELEILQRYLEMLQKDKSWRRIWRNKKLVKRLEKTIEVESQKLSRWIEKKKDSQIDPAAKELLLDGMEYAATL